MKKFLVVFFASVFIMLSFQVSAAENGKVINVLYSIFDIQINGVSKIPEDDNLKPFIYNGNTFVPLRFIAENLNQEVSWDAKTSTIHINSKNEEENSIIEESENDTENITNEKINKDIEEFIIQVHSKFKEEDYRGYLNYFSDMYIARNSLDKYLKDYWAAFDTITKIKNLEILRTKDDEIIVSVEEYIERKNNKGVTETYNVEFIYILKKNSSTWIIYDVAQAY